MKAFSLVLGILITVYIMGNISNFFHDLEKSSHSIEKPQYLEINFDKAVFVLMNDNYTAFYSVFEPEVVYCIKRDLQMLLNDFDNVSSNTDVTQNGIRPMLVNASVVVSKDQSPCKGAVLTDAENVRYINILEIY